MDDQSAGRDTLALGIVTADAPALLAFYTEVLGFPQREHLSLPDVEVTMLDCGPITLKIAVPRQAPAGADRPSEIMAVAGLRYFTVWVDDVDAVVERCRRAGAAVGFGPKGVPPDLRIAVVSDPDGNPVELVARVVPQQHRPDEER